MSRRLVSSLAACLAVAACAATLPCRAESVADALSEEVRAVFRANRAAVVKIEASDQAGQLCGTGFFIDPDGTLLTSYSVGGESAGIIVTAGDAKYPARRLVADCRSGIAVLQIDKPAKPTPFLALGKSTALSVAAPVMTIAYPAELPLTPNFGMVAGFSVKHLGRYFATQHIRANVAVQRGEGGAPLLNMRGEVVGVIISSIDGGTSCFALPVEAAEKVRRDYLRFGKIRPGWLGIKVAKATGDPVHGSTARVEDVLEKTPALEAGVHPGDIVVKIGDVPVASPDDVIHASFFLTAGDSVPVTVWRGDREMTFEIRAAERDARRNGAKRPSDIPLSAPFNRSPGIPFGTEDITLRPEP